MIGPNAASLLLYFAVHPLLAQAQSYLIGTYAGGGLPTTPSVAVNASLGQPQSVAVDGKGNVYLSADNCVFRVDTSGTLTRVAGSSSAPGFSGDGGAATSARLAYPAGIALDSAGNLYIADSGNHRIRKVAAANGSISTIAGTGFLGFSGEGGTATAARLSGPSGVAVDVSGNLYIADTGNNRVRKLTAANGLITTVAGNGSFGYAGDGSLRAGRSKPV